MFCMMGYGNMTMEDEGGMRPGGEEVRSEESVEAKRRGNTCRWLIDVQVHTLKTGD